MIDFDVILPTIGRESLPTSINSVLKQTWENFTLIIVFDRSHVGEDYVYTIKDAFNDPRIKFCSIFPCDGINNWSGTDARNLAIQFTSSPWIAYIDDDDLWMPNHLETFVEMAKNGHNMLHTRGAMVQYKRRHPLKKEKVRKRVSYHDDPTTVGMAHTRELFNCTGGWQAVENHDHILWHEMISVGGKFLLNSTITYEFLR